MSEVDAQNYLFVFLFAIAAGTVAGLAGLAGPRWLLVGWVAPVGYVALVTVGGLAIGSGLPWSTRARIPAVLATMHLPWGVGFLVGPRHEDA